MKAKLSIWTMTAVAGLFFAVSPVNAGLPQSNIYASGNVVVNNYNMNDFGYHYSSRISRFHNSYSTFDYYAPVFTETYWYNYEPYTWGMTIYSNGGFGVRYGSSWSFPAYYNAGWYGIGYSDSFYYGYSPFYFDWYTPVVINVRVRNYYPSYYTRYPAHYYGGGYNVVNNYYYGNNYYGNSNYSNPRYNYPSSPYPSSGSNVSYSRRNSYSSTSVGSNSSNRRVVAGTAGTGAVVSDRGGNSNANTGNTNVNSNANSNRRAVNQGNTNTKEKTNNGAIVDPNNDTRKPATVTNNGRGTVPRNTGSTNNSGNTGNNVNTRNTGNAGNTGNSATNRNTINNSTNTNINKDIRTNVGRVIDNSNRNTGTSNNTSTIRRSGADNSGSSTVTTGTSNSRSNASTKSTTTTKKKEETVKTDDTKAKKTTTPPATGRVKK